MQECSYLRQEKVSLVQALSLYMVGFHSIH